MKLDEITDSLRNQGDDVLKQKIKNQDPLDSAIALALLGKRDEVRAAEAAKQVAPIAQQPPVTQGIFPVIVQATQQLMQQRAMAPQGGLRTVEQPVQMASGGIVSFQQGGMPILNPRLRELLTSTPDTGDVDRLVAMEVDRELRANPSQDRAQLENRIRQQYVRPSFTPNVEGASPTAARPTAQQAAEFFGLGSVAPRPTGNRPPAGPRPTAPIPAAPAEPQGGIVPMMPRPPNPWDVKAEQTRLAAQPEELRAEDIHERKQAALRRYGLDAPNQNMIEQMQREIEQQKAEEKDRDMRAAHAGAVAAIGSGNLSQALGRMAQGSFKYEEDARNAAKIANLYRERAIAQMRDADIARGAGDLEKAFALEAESKKSMQQYRAKLAELDAARAQEEAKLEAEAARAAELRKTQLKITEMEQAGAKEREHIRGGYGIQAAKAGREGTLDMNKLRLIQKAENDYIEAQTKNLNTEFLRLSPEEQQRRAREAVMARFPQLYADAVGSMVGGTQGAVNYNYGRNTGLTPVQKP